MSINTLDSIYNKQLLSYLSLSFYHLNRTDNNTINNSREGPSQGCNQQRVLFEVVDSLKSLLAQSIARKYHSIDQWYGHHWSLDSSIDSQYSTLLNKTLKGVSSTNTEHLLSCLNSVKWMTNQTDSQSSKRSIQTLPF